MSVFKITNKKLCMRFYAPADEWPTWTKNTTSNVQINCLILPNIQIGAVFIYFFANDVWFSIKGLIKRNIEEK